MTQIDPMRLRAGPLLNVVKKGVSFWWTWKCEKGAWTGQGIQMPLKTSQLESRAGGGKEWRKRRGVNGEWRRGKGSEWGRVKEGKGGWKRGRKVKESEEWVRERAKTHAASMRNKREKERDEGTWIQPFLTHSRTFQLWEMVNPFWTWVGCCGLPPCLEQHAALCGVARQSVSWKAQCKPGLLSICSGGYIGKRKKATNIRWTKCAGQRHVW